MPPKGTESGTFYAVIEMPGGRRRYSTVSEIETLPDCNPKSKLEGDYLL